MPLYRFGDFELDEKLFELRRGGRPIRIEPKVFDVLAYLLHQHDRVVTRDELLSALWNVDEVSDAALSSCIRDARRAVGDDGSRQQVIKTTHGRGFRFAAPMQVVAVGDPAAPERAAAGRFVGRAEVLTALRAAVGDVAAGRGRCILLSGEAGIGKTRTADELAAIAGERGCAVLSGRASETPGAPAFWPWTQILRGYAATRASQTCAMDSDVAALCATPGDARTDRRPAASMRQTRFRVFDQLAELFKRAAAEQPLVLILDDLHRADVATLLALEFLAREVRPVPLLLLGAYRDTDIGAEHILTRIAGDLARLDWCARIELTGLSVSEVHSFLEQTLGATPAEALVTTAFEKSAGNPFFLTEIAPLLRCEGTPGEGSVARLPIPRTTRDAVMRRLDTLPADSRAVLAAGAVLGRELDTLVLDRMVNAMSPVRRPRSAHRRVRTALEAAERARLIEPVENAPRRYRFAHVLIRDALYDALSSTRRRRLHLLAGLAMEAVYRFHRDPHAPALAHHFSSAAEETALRKALGYSLQAAQRAVSLLAYENAVELYRHALDLSESGARLPAARARGRNASSAQQRRCEILLALGDNQWKAGDRPAARETIARAAEVARACRSWTHLAHAALAYGGGFSGFDIGVFEPALVALLEEARRRLPARPTPLRARILGRLAVAIYHVPDSLPRRRDLTREAIRVAVASRDRAAHLAALYSRHWGTWAPENATERLRVATTMVRLSAAAGDTEMALHAHRFRMIDQLEHGALREFDRALAACERLAAELRQPYYYWYVAAARTARAVLRSDFQDALRLAADAREWGLRAQSVNVANLYATHELVIHRELGQLAAVAPRIRAIVEQYPMLAWRPALAFVYAESGQHAEAQAQLDVVATHDFAGIPRDPFWVAGMMFAADACALLADRRRAGVLYRLLLPFAHRTAHTGMGGAPLGSVARALGRLAALLGRTAAAVQHFDAARRMHEGLQSPHLIAHVQREHAEALFAAGESAKALRLQRSAVALYERLGMRLFAERAARCSAPEDGTRSIAAVPQRS